MYMSDCTFAMSDCISQMLETHFGIQIHTMMRYKYTYDSQARMQRKGEYKQKNILTLDNVRGVSLHQTISVYLVLHTIRATG